MGERSTSESIKGNAGWTDRPVEGENIKREMGERRKME